MKITYELDTIDDEFNCKLFESAGSIYIALDEIKDLTKSYEKGYEEHTLDDFVERIDKIISESEHYRIQ